MIAGDGDGVELWHMVGGIGHDVGHDAHRGLGWIDEGVPYLWWRVRVKGEGEGEGVRV